MKTPDEWVSFAQVMTSAPDVSPSDALVHVVPLIRDEFSNAVRDHLRREAAQFRAAGMPGHAFMFDWVVSSIEAFEAANAK